MKVDVRFIGPGTGDVTVETPIVCGAVASAAQAPAAICI